MTKYIVEIRYAGSQVRAYGPSVKDVVVTYDGPAHPTRDELADWQIERMREIAQAAVGRWYVKDEDDMPGDWYIYTEKSCHVDHENNSVRFIAERPWNG